MFIIVRTTECWYGFPLLCDCGSLTLYRSTPVEKPEDVCQEFVNWLSSGYSRDPAKFSTREEAERIISILEKVKWYDGREFGQAIALPESRVVRLTGEYFVVPYI